VVVDHPLGEALHVLDLGLLHGELAGLDLEQAPLRGIVDELPIFLGERRSLGLSLGGVLLRLALGSLRTLLGALPLSALLPLLGALPLSALLPLLGALPLSALLPLLALPLLTLSLGWSPLGSGALGERCGGRQAHRSEDSSK